MFLLATFIYLYYLSQVSIEVIPNVLQAHNPTGYHDYKGVTHAHTTRDIGSGDLSHVITAAREARLDFLIITTLNQFPGEPTTQSYDEGVLVFGAAEYSYLDSHILFYTMNGEPNFESLGQAQIYITDLLTQKNRESENGLLVVAHPLRPGFTWETSDLPGLNGIEVLNLKSIWENSKTQSPLHFLWSALIYPFNSNLSFLRTYVVPEREEVLWDNLNKAAGHNLVLGFVGNNSTATAVIVPQTRLKFPEYSVSFSLASNHVLLESELTGDFEKDRLKVMTALSQGRFYLSLDLLADPKGFFAQIADNSRIYPMGSRLKFNPGLKLQIGLPAQPMVPYEVVLYRDGVPWQRASSIIVENTIPGPGTYRVVVRVQAQMPFPDSNKWIHWIYSNPFVIE